MTVYDAITNVFLGGRGMQDAFSRMEILLGDEGSRRLAKQNFSYLALAALALTSRKRWHAAVWAV